MSEVHLASVEVGGATVPWIELGFALDGRGNVSLRNGAIVFGDGDGDGMTALTIEGAPAGDLEGIPVRAGSRLPATEHPNGVFEFDHIVVVTDSIDRTSGVIAETWGLPLKRVRDAGAVRQGFHRFADETDARGCIVEVVERPDQTSTGLFGLVVNVADLHGMCDMLGPDVVSIPRAAVQQGRYIATVRAAAGLGVPVAFMTPG